MPVIRRSMHATRSRADPLRRNKENSRAPKVRDFQTVDGLVHGWQFKAKYEGGVVPEVRR